MDRKNKKAAQVANAAAAGAQKGKGNKSGGDAALAGSTSPPALVRPLSDSDSPPFIDTPEVPLDDKLLSQVLSSHTFIFEPALKDEDLFIPDSLSDRLSPGERSRRMSRTNSGQQLQPQALQQQRPAFSTHSSASGGLGVSRHHYSRSVPAPSIWSPFPPPPSPPPSPPPTPSHLPNQNQNPLPIGNFESTSSSSSTNFGGRSSLTTGGEGLSQSYTDRDPSLSMLSPTSASAAPLGGIHHHFLNAQTALSPSTRAFQSHAPGQSLPQGLAAGYPSIHALLPPPNIGSSPSFSGGVGSRGSPVGGGSPGSGGLEWAEVSSDSSDNVRSNHAFTGAQLVVFDDASPDETVSSTFTPDRQSGHMNSHTGK